MRQDHLSPGHDFGLPRQVDWASVAVQVVRLAERMSYPPEHLALIAPDATVRGWYTGTATAVGVPHPRDLGLLYQAVIVHEHGERTPLSWADVITAVRASSPLLVVLAGDQAHLVSVWHRIQPGVVAALMERAPALESAIASVKGTWRTVPRANLGRALREVAVDYRAFAGFPDRDEAGSWPARELPPLPSEPIDLREATKQPSSVTYELLRYLSRLREAGRFAYHQHPDGTVTLSLDGRARTFPSRAAAWQWLGRAHFVDLHRLFDEE